MFFGLFKSSTPTLTDGEQYQLLVDASGNLKVSDQGGNVASGATDSGNPVKVGGRYNSTPPTFTDGQRGDLQISAKGELFVGIADPSSGAGTYAPVYSPSDGAGSQNGLGVTARAQLFNGSSWDRQKKPNAVSRIASSAATTNATSGKASAGEVHSITAMNTTASVKYLKLYNKATAPTVGTDTPVLTIALPVSNAAYTHNFPNGGLYFSTGIAYALTGAAADNDTTALASGDVVGLNIAYS